MQTKGTGPCEFRCRDKTCLPSLPLVCNGRPDCRDKSDEFGCPPGAPALYTGPQRLDMSGVQICVIAVAVVLTLGLITCVINHYNKMGARSWSDRRRHDPPTERLPSSDPCPNIASALYSPASAQGKAKLEMAAFRDHQLRMYSVQKDFAYDLPATIHLPEDYSMRVIHLKSHSPDNEVHRAYIRPPPNRTVPSRSHSRDRPILPHKKTCCSQTAKATLVMRSPSASSPSAVSGGPEGWLPPTMLTAPLIPLAPDGYDCSSSSTTSRELAFGDRFDPPPKYEDIMRTDSGV